MSRRRDTPGERVAYHMRRILKALDHIERPTVVAESSTVSPVAVRVTATGWSASLHRRRMVVPLSVDITHQTSPMLTEHDVQGRNLTVAELVLEPFLVRQRERHDAAIRLGLMTTTRGSKVPRDAALDPRQIAIDRISAQLLAERGINPLRLVQHHRDHAPETGRQEFVSADRSCHGLHVSMMHPIGGYGVPTILVELDITRSSGIYAVFGGISISVATILPETLLGAAIARPLGATIETGIPHLDARIVTNASSFDGHVTFHFAPNTITIGQALATTPLNL